MHNQQALWIIMEGKWKLQPDKKMGFLKSKLPFRGIMTTVGLMIYISLWSCLYASLEA